MSRGRRPKRGQRQARSFFFCSLPDDPPLRTTTLHVQVRPLLLKSSTSTWRVVVGGGSLAAGMEDVFFLSKALLRH